MLRHEEYKTKVSELLVQALTHQLCQKHLLAYLHLILHTAIKR